MSSRTNVPGLRGLGPTFTNASGADLNPLKADGKAAAGQPHFERLMACTRELNRESPPISSRFGIPLWVAPSIDKTGKRCLSIVSEEREPNDQLMQAAVAYVRGKYPDIVVRASRDSRITLPGPEQEQRIREIAARAGANIRSIHLDFTNSPGVGIGYSGALSATDMAQMRTAVQRGSAHIPVTFSDWTPMGIAGKRGDDME